MPKPVRAIQVNHQSPYWKRLKDTAVGLFAIATPVLLNIPNIPTLKNAVAKTLEPAPQQKEHIQLFSSNRPQEAEINKTYAREEGITPQEFSKHLQNSYKGSCPRFVAAVIPAPGETVLIEPDSEDPASSAYQYIPASSQANCINNQQVLARAIIESALCEIKNNNLLNEKTSDLGNCSVYVYPGSFHNTSEAVVWKPPTKEAKKLLLQRAASGSIPVTCITSITDTRPFIPESTFVNSSTYQACQAQLEKGVAKARDIAAEQNNETKIAFNLDLSQLPTELKGKLTEELLQRIQAARKIQTENI